MGVAMRSATLAVTTLILFGTLFGLWTTTIQAHPGGTDGAGCHTCRTNCTQSWGISYGYYHRHNPVRPCSQSAPVQPIRPIEPIQPIQPIQPLEPIQPLQPVRPIQPVIPRVPIIPTPSNRLPSVNLSGTFSVEEGHEARFSASADDPDGYVRTYRWSFGDGKSTTGTNDSVSHEFTTPGQYRVSVTVVDDDGGRSSDTFTIEVEGKKWPLTRGQMTGIVLGGLFALWVAYSMISAFLGSRRPSG